MVSLFLTFIWQDRHVYVYFSDDAALVKTLELYPEAKANLRVCQGLSWLPCDDTKLDDSAYLPLDVQATHLPASLTLSAHLLASLKLSAHVSLAQREETLRNVLHLKVLYRGSEEVADLYFLRGEVCHL